MNSNLGMDRAQSDPISNTFPNQLPMNSSSSADPFSSNQFANSDWNAENAFDKPSSGFGSFDAPTIPGSQAQQPQPAQN